MSVPRTQLRLHAVTASLSNIQAHASEVSVPTAAASIGSTNLETALGEFAGAIKRIHGGDDFTNQQAGVFAHTTSVFSGSVALKDAQGDEQVLLDLNAGSVSGSGDFLAGGNLTVEGTSDLTGAVQMYSTLDVDGTATLASAVVEDLTDGRVALVGMGGTLVDDVEITHSAGTLTVSGSTLSKDITVAQDLTVTRDLSAVSGSFTGDVTISGNLIVSGDSVTVNVGEVLAEDNTITLNSGEVGAGVTAGTAGIEIDRGSADNALFQWNESTDKFETMVGAAYADLRVDDLEAVKGTFSGDVTVTGSLVVSGTQSSILAETLTITAPNPAGAPVDTQSITVVTGTLSEFTASNGTITIDASSGTSDQTTNYFYVNIPAIAGVNRKITFTNDAVNGPFVLAADLMLGTIDPAVFNAVYAASGSVSPAGVPSNNPFDWSPEYIIAANTSQFSSVYGSYIVAPTGNVSLSVPAGESAMLVVNRRYRTAAQYLPLNAQMVMTVTGTYAGKTTLSASEIVEVSDVHKISSNNIFARAVSSINLEANDSINIATRNLSGSQPATVAIGGTYTNAVNLQAGGTINIGTLAGSFRDKDGVTDVLTTINIGSTVNSGSVTINAGASGAITLQQVTSGSIRLINNAGAIDIGGTTASSVGAINIGSNSSASRAITMGHASNTGAMNLRGGSGGISLTSTGGSALVSGSAGVKLETTGGQAIVSGSTGIKLKSGAGLVKFADQYTSAIGSTWGDAEGIKLSNSALEWADFEATFGSEVSLLKALVGGGSGGKFIEEVDYVGTIVSGSLLANVDGGSNFATKWGLLPSAAKVAKTDVFVNGALMVSGSSKDYTIDSNGDITFGFQVVEDDVVSVVVR